MTGELHHHHDIHQTQPTPQGKFGTQTPNLERTPTAPDGQSKQGLTSSLTLTQSHLSSHDIHQVPTNASSFVEVRAAQYERFSSRRRMGITTILSLCGFLAPISSTTILSAIPEVAHEYDTSGSIINVSNGLYLIMMGLSPCLWGPISTLYGRRTSMHHYWWALFRILCRHGSSSKLGIVLRFPAINCLPGYSFSDSWELMHWRHIYTNRKRYCTQCVPVRHIDSPSVRTVPRWHHRYLPELARHILGADCIGRTCYSACDILPPGDGSGKEM